MPNRGSLARFHLYFITLASAVTDAVCTCSSCGGQFRSELWRYNDFVPEIEASILTMELKEEG